MRTSAIFDAHECYRYVLRWQWDATKHTFVTIMLNPSLANKHQLDPTCKRIMRMAAELNFGEFVVLNVGAGISQSPRKWLSMHEPIGNDNYVHIDRVLCEKRTQYVLVAWGAHAPRTYVESILAIIASHRLDMYSLGINKDGSPKHPLYVPGDVVLRPWRREMMQWKE